jgi:ComEC/Rec2-related protein
MKQPLILFSSLFAVGVFCGEKGWLSYGLLGVLAGVAVLGWLLGFRKGKFSAGIRTGALLVTGLVCGGLFLSSYTALLVQPVRNLDGQIYWADATVTDYPEIYEDSIRAEISVNASVEAHVRRNFKSQVNLPLEYKTLKPGDTVHFLAKFYQANVYDGLDKRSYLESKGLYIQTTCKDTLAITVQSRDKLPVWVYPKKAAHSVQKAVQALYSQREAGFLTAVLLGDKSGIQAEDYVALQKAGIVHVTAVSGMHVGFLVAFLLLVFGRRRGSLIALLFVIFFVFMAGATPSVVRAAIMYAMMTAAYWLNREASGLNSMFLALLLLLLWNPYALFGLSLQLSFAATAGILLFSEKICKLIPGKSVHKPVQKLLLYGKQTVACTAGSMIFTTPILVLSFDYLSVVSVVTNFLVLPAVSVLFILGYLSCVLFGILPVLAKGIALVGKAFIWYILSISGLISRFSYAVVFTKPAFCLAILGLMYLVLALDYRFRRKISARWVAVGVLALWLAAGLGGALRSGREAGVTVLSTGNGQAILCSSEQGGLALVDCSGSGGRDSSGDVHKWMLLHGYSRLDLLVLTAVDQSHARAVPELLQAVPVKQLVLPESAKNKDLEQKILSLAQKQGIPVLRCGAEGQEFAEFSMKLWGDIENKIVVETPPLLIVQSLTQNMLAEFLQVHPMQAKRVALASANMENEEKLNAALDILKPEMICLESGYEDSEEIAGISIYNTFIDGELSLQN